jgi:hypothetical protein
VTGRCVYLSGGKEKVEATATITNRRGPGQTARQRQQSPAFLFYPRDFRGSRRVQSMSFAARGMLLELLCEQWEKGSVPPSPEECAADFGGGSVAWKTAWKKLRACFVVRKHDGRLVNLKLKQIRDEREAYLKAQRQRGLAGARLRWPAHSEPIAAPQGGDGVAIANHSHRSGSGSGSGSDLKEKDLRRRNKHSLSPITQSAVNAFQGARK